MADLNIIVSAETADARRQLAQLQAQVKNTSTQIKKTTGVHNQYGKQLDKNTRGLSTFAKSGLQQTGYQVGDFAVQLQGGTSFMQAFGRQGSQLLQIFGPVGAILGALVAIGGALGTVFIKAQKAAFGLTETTTALNEAMTATKTISGDLVNNADDLRKVFGTITPEVVALAEAQRVLNFQEQVRTYHAASNALSVYADKVAEAGEVAKKGFVHRTLGENIQHMMESFSDLTEGLGTTDLKAINQLGDNLRAVAGAEGFDAVVKAVTEARHQLARMGATSSEKGQEIQEALTAVVENARAVEMGFRKMNEAFVPDNFDEAMRFHEEALSKVGEQTKVVSETISQSFGDAFGDIIMGAKSTKDAFRDMASSIYRQLIDILIIQKMVGRVGTGGAGSGGTGLAGLLSGTRATGGPVTAGKTYLVGENGPELMTAGSNGNVIPNNQISGGTTVVQNINISTGVSQTVRAEMVQLMPQIVNAAKAGVLDAKKRGGSYGAAF